MKRLRQYMQENPSLGWIVAAVLALAAAFMLYSRITRTSETTQLTQSVTIRDAETGDTWEMPRGAIEKELYLRAYPLDLTQGLVNPKTGKPNGYPIDAWKETVTRINAERAALAEAEGRGAETPAAPKNP